MTGQGLLQLALYVVVLVALVKPLGAYMAAVFRGERTFMSPVLGPVERLIYRVSGIDPAHESDWKSYALSALLVNLLGFVAVYALQRLQHLLPLNPQGLGAVSPDSSFNTAVSFATNTNWQGYVGEATMSYLTQMLGLAVQNFLSAAAGIAVLIALIRGFVRRESGQIGNFWVDFTRSTLYVLLPLSCILAVVLACAGRRAVLRAVPAGDPGRTPGHEGPGRHRADTAARPGREPGGDQATRHQRRRLLQRQLGASVREPDAVVEFPRGAGHPADPGRALLHLRQHGRRQAAGLGPAGGHAGDLRALAGRRVRGRAVWQSHASMRSVWTRRPRRPQSGGNMEGKETRFGIANSALWATATTAASNGSVNAMHDSFTPLGGLVPMWLMQLGEVVFGGVGSGLYGMLMFAIIAVFIAGLMVGRTPEYLGKKIEAYEVKMAAIVLLVPCLVVLLGTAVAVTVPAATASVANPGVHGFSEILYAFSSAGNNNGSAFAGLSANTPFYNFALGIAMWVVALLADDSGAGHRRQPGRQTRDGHHGGHAAHAHASFRHLAGDHGAAGRRTHVPARARARPDRGAPPAAWEPLR